MKHTLEQVGIDFLERAEQTFVMDEVVRASRSEVWDAFVDAPSWSQWFMSIKRIEYVDAHGNPLAGAPGIGSRRDAVGSGQHFLEVMIAWDVGERFAYYVERASWRVATAYVDCFRFEDCPEGTRVRWTIAMDPTRWTRLLAPLFRRQFPFVFRRAMRGLERYLEQRSGSGSKAASAASR